MKISVIIPTRNEEHCIGRTLKEMPRDMVDEVIIVDGNSEDNTLEEIRQNLKTNDKLIIQKESKGYGAAFREGIAAATGDVIIMMDADGSHNPADIPALLEKINEGYEYVMASRYAKGGRSEDDTFIRWFGNWFFTRLTNLVYGMNVTDSIYLYTAIVADKLKKINFVCDGFEFCTEILVKAHKAGLRFAEVPVVERARFAGRSKVNAFWHGLKYLFIILKGFKD